eukprot:g24713.t1
MVSSLIQPNNISYNAIISSCEKGRQWQAALSIFHAMQLASHQPDVISYSAVLSSFEKGRQWQPALIMLENMIEVRVTPHVISYNAVMSACENGRQWQHAWRTFEAIVDAELEPSVISYNAVMSACEKAGQWQVALYLFNEMPQMKLLPDPISRQTAISSCERAMPRLSSIDKNGRNLWVYISRQTPAELPMLVALVGILMTTSAAFGETPVLLVAYALVWAKVVCGKLEVGQPRTWCWLQSLAQLGLVVMSLLYLVAPALTGRSSEAVQTLYKAFPELKREHYLKIVLPHLVLGCCAYLERLRIAQAERGLRDWGRSWIVATLSFASQRCLVTEEVPALGQWIRWIREEPGGFAFDEPSVRFAPSTVEAVHRDKLHRLRVHRPGMEERILTWLIPSWMEFMPLNMHVYLSALLLVLVFALSIQEVNILSFLMMLAVICLCGWSNRWVQAGNVFSCTTLAVMWLQYLARSLIFRKIRVMGSRGESEDDLVILSGVDLYH